MCVQSDPRAALRSHRCRRERCRAVVIAPRTSLLHIPPRSRVPPCASVTAAPTAPGAHGAGDGAVHTRHGGGAGQPGGCRHTQRCSINIRGYPSASPGFPNLNRSLALVGRNLGQIWPIPGNHSPQLVKFRPNLADCGRFRTTFNRILPSSGKTRPIWVEFGPHVAEFRHFGRVRANCGRFRATFKYFQACTGLFWLASGQNW